MENGAKESEKRLQQNDTNNRTRIMCMSAPVFTVVVFILSELWIFLIKRAAIVVWRCVCVACRQDRMQAGRQLCLCVCCVIKKLSLKRPTLAYWSPTNGTNAFKHGSRQPNNQQQWHSNRCETNIENRRKEKNAKKNKNQVFSVRKRECERKKTRRYTAVVEKWMAKFIYLWKQISKDNKNHSLVNDAKAACLFCLFASFFRLLLLIKSRWCLTHATNRKHKSMEFLVIYCDFYFF